MNDKYILDGKTPVKEPNLKKWAEWWEKADRTVRSDKVIVHAESICVSTVFLGLDHSFRMGGPPLLFETLIFGGPLDGDMYRCPTWEDAMKIHKIMCEKVKSLSEQ